MIRSYLVARFRSFGYALNGVRVLISTQPHAKLHLISSVIVLTGGAYLKIERSEWIAILICIGMVWMAEAMNTATEFLADEVSLEKRELIEKAKDVAAAGVLIVATTSVVVAGLILAGHLK